MGLYLANTTYDVISACVLYYDQGCPAADPFRKAGWYNLYPGFTLLPNVFNYPLTKGNRYAGVWAYSSTQEFPTTGSPYDYWVTSGVHFSQCINDNDDCPRYAQFALLDLAGRDTAIAYIGGGGTGGVYIGGPGLTLYNWGAYTQVIATGFAPRSTIEITLTFQLANGGGNTSPLPYVTDASGEVYTFIDNVPGTENVNGRAVDLLLPELTATYISY